MISVAFVQCCVIVVCHFIVYTLQWNSDLITKKLIKTFTTKKRSSCFHDDVAALNIPECTYNYNEYQDGLVSGDFM